MEKHRVVKKYEVDRGYKDKKNALTVVVFYHIVHVGHKYKAYSIC